MTESERPYDPPPEAETPPAEKEGADGPLTQEEVEHDPAYDPDDEELGRLKGG